MRELKFRAWDNQGKHWYPAETMKDFFDYLSEKFAIIADWFNKDVISLEQYTGLKDKYGKEIYEGDIVREKWFDEEAYRGENRVGKVEYFTDGFVCWFVGGRMIQLGMLVGSHIEVIGNIHENPELLEAKNVD